MEFHIDEQVLNDYLKLLRTDGEMNHKGIYALLSQLAMMGYLHRDSHKVVLHNNDSEADLDEDYEKYLDNKAAGREITNWEDRQDESQ
jgi:hypothetical protein|tara:strand:- start:896 stop:1159 length:264 start_codon:yes stop_codon:yes gene_type:complete